MDELRKNAAGAFSLVDRVLALEGGRRGVGLKNVSANEHYFKEGSVLPEAAVTEALVQMTAVVLRGGEHGEAGKFGPACVREMEFWRAVRPGDHLILYSDIIESSEDSVRARVRAEVEGETVAEGEIAFAADRET